MFSNFNLHSQIYHLNFHREKSMLIDFFSNRKYFFPRLSIFISARILVSATKLANIKLI